MREKSAKDENNPRVQIVSGMVRFVLRVKHFQSFTLCHFPAFICLLPVPPAITPVLATLFHYCRRCVVFWPAYSALLQSR
jgi:hypothetical protein